MKLNKVVHLYLEQLENYTLKIMKKYLEIYQKTWKNHENIMEFCQSGKVGTLKSDFENPVYNLGLHWVPLTTCNLIHENLLVISGIRYS